MLDEPWRYGLVPCYNVLFVIKEGFGDFNALNCRPGTIIEVSDIQFMPREVAKPYSRDQALEDFRETEGI